MGLLMVRTASDKAAEMLDYAHETQHEKIIRGLALGIALTVYGRENEADTLIEQMTQDPILRYCLSSSYLVYSHPLELDFTTCELQTPCIVSLLSESYDPHVRYGAALAFDIRCSGLCLSRCLNCNDYGDGSDQRASDSHVGAFRRQFEKSFWISTKTP